MNELLPAGIDSFLKNVGWGGAAIDPIPGDEHRAVLAVIGPIFVDSGDVADQQLIDDALDSLFFPEFARAADPSDFR